MGNVQMNILTRLAIAVLALSIPFIIYANPNLTPGVWTDITPSFLKGTSFQTCGIAFDPSNRSILYLTGSFNYKLGLLKSTDGGSSWARVGNPPASPNYSDTVDYLDAPYQVAVDPANSNHIIATEMSPGGGVTLGFWVTYNGGAKWVRTKGFMDAVKAANATTDVGHFDVDPTDFNHILICHHYYWNGNGPSGVFETKDGGNTFTVHYPAPGMGSASKAVFFLYDPSLGVGDKNTWLVIEDMSGIWRTSDAGTTWSKSSSMSTPHGGTSNHVYTKAGVLYTGGGQTLIRSRDNGITWESVPNTGIHMYYALCGDGEKLYIGGAGAVSSPWPAWFTSPETNCSTWTSYSAGPTAPDGPTDMRFDSVNRIMYSANATAGAWALKVAGASTNALKTFDNTRSISTMQKAEIHIAGLPNGKMAGLRVCFDIRGKAIDKIETGRQAVIIRGISE